MMTTQQLLNRLRLLKADLHCSVCGDVNWEQHDDAIYVLPKAEDGVALDGGVSCVAMFCRTCGHARFHSANILSGVEVAG
jgi:hypothetical protein